MQKKPQFTVETALMGVVSLLGLVFLIAATNAFIRAMNTPEETPVAHSIESRQTQQVGAAEATPTPRASDEPDAPPSQAAPLVATTTPQSDAVVTVVVTSLIPTQAPTETALPTSTLAPTVVVAVTEAGLPTAAPPPTEAPATAPAAPPPPSATPVPPGGGYAYNMGLPPAPGPSPTWSVYDLYTPMPASGPSKLSWHVQLACCGLLEWIEEVQPPLIKSVADMEFLRRTKEISPDTITIGRYIVDDWQHIYGQGDPAQQAIDFVNDQLPKYLEHAEYVDYWEGYNETVGNWEWYAQFEATRACEMQKHGLKAAIGSFSTGVPEPWQFELFLPAVEAAKRCGGILSLHEYGAPTYYLWWGQGIPSVPGQPHYPDRGPLAGRYRWFYRDYLIPMDLVIPLAITEAGVDGLVALGLRPGPPAAGWLELESWWAAEGFTNDGAQFYADQLIWYDSILRQDEYVIGATIFTVSAGSSQHGTYEAERVMPLIRDYALSLKP